MTKTFCDRCEMDKVIWIEGSVTLPDNLDKKTFETLLDQFIFDTGITFSGEYDGQDYINV